MDINRYRINRKTGQIYRESNDRFTPIGSELDVAILYASEEVFGQPFPHMPAQNWVSLCFLDRQLNWSYALLNSGSTDALNPWRSYSTQFQKNTIFRVVTKIHLCERQSANYTWYSYQFTQQPFWQDLDLGEILERYSGTPLVDPTVNLPFDKVPERSEFDFPQPKIWQDERARFIVYEW